MADFAAIDEYFDAKLRLPIRGKVYEIAPPDAELGLWIKRLFMAGETAAAGGKPRMPTTLDDDTVESLHARLLGDAYQQMIDDRVPYPALELAGETALLWTAYGVEIAEKFWLSGGRPEASAPANRTARRVRKSAATGTAIRTRKPASTRTTTTSRTTSGDGMPASPTRGRRSSNGGRS